MAEKLMKAANDLIKEIEKMPRQYIDDKNSLKIVQILCRLSDIKFRKVNEFGSTFLKVCQFYHSKMFDHIESLKEQERQLKETKEEEMAVASTSCQNNFTTRRPGKDWQSKRQIQFNEPSLVQDPLSMEHSLQRTSFHMITTKNGILAMLAQLKQRTIIAYDLERSIPGFFGGRDQICLIQFSIMDADFILDTLEPEVQSNLPLLNALFADPKITKIVHGHDDKKWLANVRIQVHNQVDTSSHGNYARMVHKYCGIQIGKEFQTANWTQRPLPPQMVQYARLDTHYLIRAYYRMMERKLNKYSQHS